MSVQSALVKQSRTVVATLEAPIAVVTVVLGWAAFSNNSTYVPAALGTFAVLLAYTMPISFIVVKMLSGSSVRPPQSGVLVSSLLLVFALLVTTVLGLGNTGFEALKLIFMTSLSLGFFHAISMSVDPDRFFKIICYSGVVMFVVSGIAWASFGFPARWTFFFDNPNSFGFLLAINAVITTFFFKSKVVRIFVIIFSLVFLAFVTAKTALLCYLVFLLMYRAWPLFTKSRLRYNVGIFVLAICFIVIPYLYIDFSTSDLGREIDFFLRALLFDSALFSGRQALWPPLIVDIQKNWIFGNGAVPIIIERGSQTLSAHNFYLTLLYQGGVVALGFFVLFFYFVAVSLYRGRHIQRTRFAGAFLVAFLFTQVSEVAIFQNNLSFSYWCWLIVGLGIIPAQQAPRSMDNHVPYSLSQPDLSRVQRIIS